MSATKGPAAPPTREDLAARNAMSDAELDAELRAEGVDVDGLLADVAEIIAKANGVDRPAGDA